MLIKYNSLKKIVCFFSPFYISFTLVLRLTLFCNIVSDNCKTLISESDKKQLLLKAYHMIEFRLSM